MAEFQIEFGDGSRVETERFSFPRPPRPKLVRQIGGLVGGANEVAAYADPVFTMAVRVGPLRRADSATLRGHVSQTCDIRVDVPERPRGDYPHEGHWINRDITGARLIDAVPAFLGRDISAGEVWTLTLQFAESGIT